MVFLLIRRTPACLYTAIKTIYNGIIHGSNPHNMNLVIIMINGIISKYEL